jgi:hypothetical protein
MATAELSTIAGGGYQLQVDGEPFFIKGAGLEFGQMALLAECGGNTFRTWRVDNGQQSAEAILDEAAKRGLKVCMGLDLARERHGFDYSDTSAVAAQQTAMLADVQRLKDHPALLMWGLGNELNLRSKNPQVWDAVEALCVAIKEIDENHLVTTMLAGIDAPTVKAIKDRAPSLDFLSFQIYGEIDRLPDILKAAKFDGPYQITEWGPTGHWESPETAWQRPIEATSHQKATDIARRYHDIILADPTNCLGSYIFLWGQKQERTPTWYGLFLEDGRRTEAVDVMQHAWTGSWPAVRAPRIEDLRLNGQQAVQSVVVKPEATVTAEASVSGVDDEVALEWLVREEVPRAQQSDGGDFEPTPPTVIQGEGVQGNVFRFQAPAAGEYRLFCQLNNKRGASAVANFPFLVTATDSRQSEATKKGKVA